MPFINVKIAGPALAATQVAEIQRGITSLMAEVLQKDAALTAVLVEHVAASGWAIAGEAAARAAHVDATVSAGTNTPQQKSRFVADADALLRRVIGAALPLVTYVVVHDVPKDSWGYGGLTQAARAGASV